MSYALQPMDPSVHGISQVGILEWVVISLTRRCSQPRDRTHISCIAGRFFTTEPPGKPIKYDLIRSKKNPLSILVHSQLFLALHTAGLQRASIELNHHSSFIHPNPPPSPPPQPTAQLHGPARTRQRVGSQCERSASLAAFLS